MTEKKRDLTNYTPIHNEFIDHLCHYRISGEEYQILWSILRKTWGWHKKENAFSLSIFVEMTGLNKPHIVQAIKKLSSKNIIFVTKKGNRKLKVYEINENYGQWKTLPKKVNYQKRKLALPKMVISVTKNGNDGDQKATTGKGKPKPKYTIIKDTTIKENIYILEFEKLLSQYPNRLGKKQAQKHFLASVKNEKSLADIKKALDNYLNHLKIEAWKNPKNASTWFNNWTDWINWKDETDGGLQSWYKKKLQEEGKS